MQLFVNQLTNVDFSYLDAERGMVGETWLASALLNGALDDQGMVCDFGVVKKTLRNWLDDELDHRLLVPVDSPALSYTTSGDRIQLTWQSARGPIELDCPLQAVTLVGAETINEHSVSAWCLQQLMGSFPVNVEQLQLEFEPENIHGAFYHYSHGLKKHNGNCQRIAHGHRSRIEIKLDGRRSHDVENAWEERWCDIYIGTESDLIEQTDSAFLFAYDAPQGHFKLKIEKSHCYLMDTETTVELIATHLAKVIKAAYPQQQVEVRAFEGINKGAVAFA
ncbi:6-carboxytetrahydropterin synthase [Oceanobacter mangrovi]|uniref:6-carboxytetrahydropterin synthase n=1 Tax=Oceanobacter mangrovi TaxID=2862510 RepID=UPI001C8E003C|nr:6-carboxytetrahydropterin synthase [Oceanobacter mangrovi]